MLLGEDLIASLLLSLFQEVRRDGSCISFRIKSPLYYLICNQSLGVSCFSMFRELPVEAAIQHMVVVLGSENYECGALSPMAQARCDGALALCEQLENPILITTGGFGHHFNPTEIPHAEHLKKYLRENQSPDAPITVFPFTECSNTVEDLEAFRTAFAGVTHHFSDIEAVHVVTSDFHAVRVGLILRTELFESIPARVLQVPTPWNELSPEKREALFAHEERACDRLINQGGVSINGKVSQFRPSPFVPSPLPLYEEVAHRDPGGPSIQPNV